MAVTMRQPEAETAVWDAPRLRDPHAQADKAERVRRMFDRIARTYERVNRLSSFGRDAYWRRRAVGLAAVQPGDRVLDVACGTGDFSRAFADADVRCVVGADFAAQMLRLAAARARSGMRWCLADAQRLPFADASFSVASCAFGVRNFQDLHQGLCEMHRVLAPGGRAVILEFSLPRRPLIRALYGFYLQRVLPRIAALLSGDRSGAYDYLARSIDCFLDAPALESALGRAGFERVSIHPLTGGIVHVLIAHRPWRRTGHGRTDPGETAAPAP